MKRFVCCIAVLFFTLLCTAPAFAQEIDTDSYYKQQEQESGALDLPSHLPQETKEDLSKLGVDGADWKQISSITPTQLFSRIGTIAKERAVAPIRAAASVLAVILLCALCTSLKPAGGNAALTSAVSMVGALCICIVVVQPIVSCVDQAAKAIQAGSGFLIACIPVLVGIMAAAGQPLSAGAYHVLMLAAGNVISFTASNLLVPLLNIYLALSVVSAVSPAMNLSGVCNAFDKCVKWILGLCMTVFASLLTMHSLIAGSADNVGTRAARFVVSSFVPVVGGALADAFQTVASCVKVLKSGVSAFTLLAGLILFVPILLQCLIWMMSLFVCSGIGEIFELKEITQLLQASGKVVQMMLVILLCCMAVLTVSTVVMLVIGGAAS